MTDDVMALSTPAALLEKDGMMQIKDYERSVPIKLAILMCSNRPMEPRCAMALSMLVHHLSVFAVPFGIISRIQASLLPQARQECLDEALADNCTHHLWWDDDVEAPGDCVLRWLQAMRMDARIDVIAANYCRKQDTLQYTAEDLNGGMMESYLKFGVEEANKIGMGLVLMKTDKLRDIPAPHFEIRWSEKHRRYVGEDRYFIQKLRDAGLRVFVDHGLSNHTQHWGSIGYNFAMFNPPAPGNVSDEVAHRLRDGVGE